VITVTREHLPQETQDQRNITNTPERVNTQRAEKKDTVVELSTDKDVQDMGECYLTPGELHFHDNKILGPG
jgi:hypothetical protein